METADAERLRGALGKALEARDLEDIKTPDSELAYDTIQWVRHVLLSEGVRLGKKPANRLIGQVPRPNSPECVEGFFSEVGLEY